MNEGTGYEVPDIAETQDTTEDSLFNETIERDELVSSGSPEVEDELENSGDLEVLDETRLEEVFEGLDEYDFDSIDYAAESERLDDCLDDFKSDRWESLSLDEKKRAMKDLSDYVKDVVGLENPPAIDYYYNPVEGDYGGYCDSNNMVIINEFMLYNNREAVDTVAHELWHAYQHQRARNPRTVKDFQYQFGFDNYIRYEDDPIGYNDQMVEAEARAFAQQFKDRLNKKEV